MDSKEITPHSEFDAAGDRPNEVNNEAAIKEEQTLPTEGKLTYSIFMRIFTLIGGLALTGLFGWFSAYFFLKNKHLSLSLLFLTLFFAVILILGIIEVFNARIEFSDDFGLVYKNGYTKPKRILKEDIESFLVASGSIFITYKSNIKGVQKSKSLHCSSYFKNLNELALWLSGFAKNLVMEQIQEEIKDFTKERYGGLSEDEKAALFKKAQLAGKILNRTGFAIAVLVFVGVFKHNIHGFPLAKASLLLSVIYPIILLFSLRLSNGLLRFNTWEYAIYPSLLSGFVATGMMPLLFDIDYINHVYDLKRYFLFAAIFTVLLFAMYYFCVDKEETSHWKNRASKIINIAALCFIFASYSFGAVIFVNCDLPSTHTELASYKAEVIDSHISKGKHTNYYLTVSPWINGKPQKKVEVKKSLYEKKEKGGMVEIVLYKGTLGIPWYWVYE